ncbi:uncharacterized protein M6B38_302915 [Iris pallida]|uniref:AT1G17665-like protein n=1 Tax=Iris pallida TaxID=29817 RepID=A0AAX6HNI0_IRIPA|nr:uncharacterized protein M6B38_302915 [Iris pallida]
MATPPLIPKTPTTEAIFLFISLCSTFFMLVSLFLLHKRKKKKKYQEEEEEEERGKKQHISPAATRLPAADTDPSPPPMPPAEAAGEEKRRKKRGKKKRQGEEAGGVRPSLEEIVRAAGTAGRTAEECASLFPFSSFASATQRRIKVQYDELVRSNQARKLTMAQVGQFVNCLVEARNELQHKSDILKRSFKIKKALLFKADRSSFDRLSQQIYKLETEHKRLEQDAAVYNLIQDQLKLSPAYKKMLEVSASMELKGPPDQTMDQAMEFSDISFEELLAQEKKDSFWQRNGRPRSFPS